MALLHSLEGPQLHCRIGNIPAFLRREFSKQDTPATTLNNNRLRRVVQGTPSHIRLPEICGQAITFLMVVLTKSKLPLPYLESALRLNLNS